MDVHYTLYDLPYLVCGRANPALGPSGPNKQDQLKPAYLDMQAIECISHTGRVAKAWCACTPVAY
jgi:hypothetical protein